MTDAMNPVPVQGQGLKNGKHPRDVPPGYISWHEHVEAWMDYQKKWPGHDAATIAKYGGFGYYELLAHLGHVPQSWRPRDEERFKAYIPPTTKLR